MLIQMKRTVDPIDGGRFGKGSRYHTSPEELERRQIPEDSYRVLQPAASSAPAAKKKTKSPDK